MKLKSFKEKDKKKIGILLFTIFSILLITGVILYRTFAIFEVNQNLNIMNGNIGSLGDLRFNFYLDDELVKEVPNKAEDIVFDSYHSYCENGTNISWNDHSWEATLKNLKESPTKCHLKFIHGYKESALNGAIPDLGNGLLTPVTIDENGAVKKADLTNSWYNYVNKTWANSVLLKENSYELLKANGKISGGAIKEEDSIHLNGVDSYINLGLSDYDFKNQVTVAISFKINDMSKYYNILGNWESAGLGIAYDADSKSLVNSFYINEKYETINIPFSNSENYHTIIARYNGSKINVWLDGELATEEVNVTQDIKSTKAPFMIGVNGNITGTVDSNESYANINVKQAAIFNRAIDESEVKEISNHFKITNSEKLLNYIDFTNKTYESNEVIPEDNIESYFVWIPRYRYQIWNGDVDSYNGVSELGTIIDATKEEELNKQKEISIVFETNDVNKSNGYIKDSWLTHPAFTSFNSNGMWVGKFETGTTINDNNYNVRKSDAIQIKPNVYSWRNIQPANAFYTSYEYLRDLESHMMKNMEWGAVAYLTYSKYGSCKGTTCTEPRINNNSKYITGFSSSTEPTCGYTGTDEECNRRETAGLNADGEHGWSYYNPKSTVASTTGNYYGIYDMAGGSWEYVMGVMQGINSSKVPATGKDANNNSGFNGPYTDGSGNKTDGLEFPESKYYDLYEYNASNQQYQRGKLGDATKELGPFYSVKHIDSAKPLRLVSSYYADTSIFVNSGNSWFIRGGSLTDGSETGIGAFGVIYGHATGGNSFRIVLMS